MKQFVLTVALMLIAGSAQAQRPLFEERGPMFENGIYVNPFSLLAGEMNVGYERAVAERTTVMLAGRVGRIDGVDSSGREFSISSAGAEIQPHFYLARRAPRGPYFAPYVGAGQALVEAGGTTYASSYVSTGSTVGWSWVWGNFNLKLGIGGEYQYGPRAIRENGETHVDVVGAPALTGDLKMGFVF